MKSKFTSAMKQLLLLLFSSFFSSFLFAQINQWTWTGGENTEGQPMVYGIKGVASPANTPGSRANAIRWTDAAGNWWLFGGNVSQSSSNVSLNDLWKYTPSNSEWTWISGDSVASQYGIYGTKGIAASTNKPTARSGAVSWMDTAGNLWLFGGITYVASGSGYLNDLWKYTPSTGQWTWVSGDDIIGQQGIYGKKGTAATANKPGARYSCVSWADVAGNLWLFGGYGYNQTTRSGTLNDLWKFAPATGQWTWMHGDSISEQRGIYGGLNEPSPIFKPGSGSGGVGWTDPAGNFWLFGGFGYSTISPGYMNDLWRYDVSTGYWGFVTGDTRENSNGSYGVKGVPTSYDKPSGRTNALTWSDPSGNLWLFGGGGLANFHSGYLNDLWVFKPSTRYWTWIDGDNEVNQTGVYGIKGTAAFTNKPGARSGAVGWTNPSGSLWLYGGGGYTTTKSGFLSDWWKYTIISPALSGFSAQPQQQTAILNWTTIQEQNTLYFSIERSSGGAYDSIGQVKAIGTANTFSTYSFTDKSPSQGLNLYRLKQVNQGGNIVYSAVANVMMGNDDARFSVIQNPVQNILQLRAQLTEAEKLTLEVRDMNGHLLISEMRTSNPGNSVFTLQTDRLAKGAYLVAIRAKNFYSIKSFTKQ